MKKTILIAGAIIAAAVAISSGAKAQSPRSDVSGVYPEAPGDPLFRVEPIAVPGSKAVLTRDPEGVDLVLDTSELAPGHAYTVWMRAFNDPTLCIGGEGVEGSVCSRGDDIPPPPQPGPPVADPCVPDGNNDSTCSVFWIGQFVVGPDGVAHFSARVDANDWPGYVILGLDQEGEVNFGLTNPLGAEIHIVLRSHGEAIIPPGPTKSVGATGDVFDLFNDDPGTALDESALNDLLPISEVTDLYRLGRQLTRVTGNCAPPGFFPDDDFPCFDHQLAFFPPPPPEFGGRLKSGNFPRLDE